MSATHPRRSRPRWAAGALALTFLVPLSAGATTTAATATPSGTPAAPAPQHCQVDPQAPKHEMRGMWVASVAHVDWPSSPSLTPEQAQAELAGYYDMAKAKGLNSVVVQVRPAADTFWPSELEPWSQYLTGTQGQDPGWDPMAFAVEEAHARGLEFHAWFNPYRVSQTTTDVTDLAPDHPARLNPDWVVTYGGQLYYDPGVPEVRELTIDVIMEAVEGYDVDGVHFDDYFYPYPVEGEEFDDADTFAEHNRGITDLGDWRRDNVNGLIEELGQRVETAKPWVSYGVSPFAVWRNAATDPTGSDTTAGAQTYDDLYADTKLWVESEWVDYVLPQIYWTIGFEPAAYEVLVPWWHDVVEGTDVDLYIGQATYKVGDSPQSPEWMLPETMSRHLDLGDDYPLVQGDVYFSANQIRANRLGHWDILQAEHYATPALPPVTGPGEGLPAPRGISTHPAPGGGTELRLNAPSAGTGFAVYRLDGQVRGKVDPCDVADATNLVAVLGEGQTSWVDPEGGRDVSYVVTALDQYNVESPPSSPRGGR